MLCGARGGDAEDGELGKWESSGEERWGSFQDHEYQPEVRRAGASHFHP